MRLFKRAAELDQSEYEREGLRRPGPRLRERRHARRAALAAAARDPLRPASRRPRRRRRLPGLRAGLQRCARLVPRARLPALPPGRRRGAVGERHPGGAAPLCRLREAREGVHGRPGADALLRQPRHRLARRRQGQEAPRPAAARHRGARGPQAQGPRRRRSARPALPGPRTPGDGPQRPRRGALAPGPARGLAPDPESPRLAVDDAGQRLRPARQARHRDVPLEPAPPPLLPRPTSARR